MKAKTKRTRSKSRRQNRRVRSPRKSAYTRTAAEFFALPNHIQDVYTRVMNTISKMRNERISLPRVMQEFGVTRRQVQRFGRKGLRRAKNGRLVAKSNDALLRVLLIPTPEGLVEIGVSGSRDASLLANYWVAVERYLQTGDASGLKSFEGQQIIDADGKRYSLLTDLNELDRLGSAGVLSFESLYGKAS